MLLLLGSNEATPLLSWDTWGLISMGVLVTVLWLLFRRLFDDGPPPPAPPPSPPPPKA